MVYVVWYVVQGVGIGEYHNEQLSHGCWKRPGYVSVDEIYWCLAKHGVRYVKVVSFRESRHCFRMTCCVVDVESRKRSQTEVEHLGD
jgi:hypothetical protein